MSQEITGRAVTLVEVDLDAYRITQFEAAQAAVAISSWTKYWTTTNLTALGVVNSNMPSGLGLEVSRTIAAANPGFVGWTTAPAIADTSAVTLLRMTNAGPIGGGLVVRGTQTTAGTAAGYVCYLLDDHSASQRLVIAKIAAGVETILTHVDLIVLPNTNYWLQFDAAATGTPGVELRAKVWTGGISDAPTDYTLSIEVTTSLITAANYAGLYAPAFVADNIHGTFRVRSLFSSLLETTRYAHPTQALPVGFNAIPNVLGDPNYTPAIVSLGADLGSRASIVVTFSDHLGADLGEFYRQGSYWGKFRARQLFRRGLPFRYICGLESQDIGDYSTVHFVLDSFSGPDYANQFSMTAVDVLQAVDDTRSQAPLINSGQLSTDLTAVATTLTLTPSGVGDLEYSLAGIAQIAGNEIITFLRSYIVLLLHADAADATTTFLDSSPIPKVATVNGNAQIDTAQFKFGGSSMLFDGTGDYLNYSGELDFAFGLGDFTIECFVRLNTTGVQMMIYDSRPAATTGQYPTLFVNASNKLIYHANAADRITGTTSLTTGAWFHVAVARSGTNTKLFLNGTQEGSTFSDGLTYINGASRPTVGVSGNNVATNGWNGWIDEMRISKGFAWYTANFTPTAVEFVVTSSGDAMTIVRGTNGSTAATHTTGDLVQQCLSYVAQSPADIIYDLFVNYGNVDASLIDLAAWESEVNTYLNRLYGRLIAVPTGISTLVSELIQQAGLAVWWDSVNETIRLLVLRPIVTTAYLYDQSNVMTGSVTVTEQPDKRITAVWTWYGVRNALNPLDQLNNYVSAAALEDLEAAELNGSSVIVKIFGTWIPQFASTTADRVNQLQLGRYVTPPRLITFNVQRYSGTDEPVLGGGYNFEYYGAQDETGLAVSIPIQVTQVIPTPSAWQVTAEEMLFVNYSTADNLHRVITIDNNTLDFDLYTTHNSIYAPITASDIAYGLTLTVIVNSGVVVGGSTTSTRAFDVGTGWVVGVPITLQNNGIITGAGGPGGFGSIAPAVAGNGQAGGTGFYTRYPITIDNSNGTINGGGGGGGGARGSATLVNPSPTGGSGGAGAVAGAGGPKGAGAFGNNGNPGTLTAGGAHLVYDVGPKFAGAGGDPGQAGAACDQSSPATGGAAGTAVDGVSHATILSPSGHINGPQIN